MNKEKRRNKVIIVFAIACIFMLTIGIAAAFYSDYIEHKSSATAGTLRIKGNYTVSLNGTTVQTADIANLNPGDVIVITGRITNEGSKSAWVRDKIVFEGADVFLPFIDVYWGNLTQENLQNSAAYSDLLLNFNENTVITPNSVIDGTVETESGAEDYYLNSTYYDIALTIYFKPEATNETQNQTFSFTIATQALQYRNNTGLPAESAWANVVAATV